MGGMNSVHAEMKPPSEQDGFQLDRSEEEIVQLMLPVYYTLDQVTQDDLKHARTSWNLVINDTSPKFLKMKAEDTTLSFTSCVMFFYDTFYNRLFDVHPLCRNMFKSGLKTQGKFLVKMISLCLSEIEESEKFNATLVKLTDVHNTRGVKSIEYGVVGEVMFYTMRVVIGEESYDSATHHAWIRIFSRMLSIMVPVAVAFEISTGGTAQKLRVIQETNLQRGLLESRNVTPTPSQPASPHGELKSPKPDQTTIPE